MEKETVRAIVYMIIAFFVIAALLIVFYGYADKLFRISVG